MQVAGLTNYLICADEAGTPGGEFYGFGSLWLPWDRAEEFLQTICDLRRQHGYEGVIRWTDVPRCPALFVELVDFFFGTRWLMFHMLVVREADVDMELHNHSRRVARRRHFAMFLRRKLADFGRTRDKAYHLVLRPDPEISGEDLSRRVNRSLDAEVQTRCLASVVERSLADAPAIGLSDVLVGAVMNARAPELPNPAMELVSARIADHLGWPDLDADTFPSVDKFNIWRFWDGTEERYETTRRVRFAQSHGALVRR